MVTKEDVDTAKAAADSAAWDVKATAAAAWAALDRYTKLKKEYEGTLKTPPTKEDVDKAYDAVIATQSVVTEAKAKVNVVLDNVAEAKRKANAALDRYTKLKKEYKNERT